MQKIDILIQKVEAIQKQIDGFTKDLLKLKLEIKVEEEKKLKRGDVVEITSQDWNGSLCIVDA